MSTSIDKLFLNFQQKLNTERFTDSNKYEDDIVEHYYEILKILSQSYENYRANVFKLLSTLENNDSKGLAYSIFIFYNLFEEFQNKEITKLDLNRYNKECTDETLLKYTKLFEETVSKNNQFRISDFDFKTESLSETEMEQICSLIIDVLEQKSETTEFQKDDVDLVIMQLASLHVILDKLGDNHLFYFIAGQCVDRLNTSEYFQIARNTVEEIILIAFKDKTPEYGFYEGFACYAGQGSTHASLLFANLSLHCFNTRKSKTYDRFFNRFIWTTIRYFRNVQMYEYAINLYKSAIDKITLSKYEKQLMDHIYFTCLLHTEEKKTASEISNYLDLERENILNGGVHGAIPWFTILISLKRVQPDLYSSGSQLDYYLKMFEAIVPKELSERFHIITFGSTLELKDLLKKSLIKLNETRDKSDVSYDNEMTLKLADRVIENSFYQNDYEATLIAMLAKSDFNLMFKSKKFEDVEKLKIPDDNIENFTKIYPNLYKEIIEVSVKHKPVDFIWLCFAERKVFELLLNNGNFEYLKLEKWNWEKFEELDKTNFFSTLTFDDIVKTQYEVRQILHEEHVQSSDLVLNKINSFRVKVSKSSESFLIVKDMTFKKFPHNLLIDENGTFLGLTRPITNILSTEWYISACKNSESLAFSKSIWIPCSDTNFEFHKLHSSLEDTLSNEGFHIDLNMMPENPLNSSINIICSHGAKDIAVNQIVYPGENPLFDLDKIIGIGNILIFFVCHSGSYQSEFLKNNITSVVKTYISKGYSAVVAPFWSLNIDIPKVWLPAFLQTLNSGESIDKAVFNANLEVFKKFPTPAAWAAMHLYGNPHLTFKN